MTPVLYALELASADIKVCQLYGISRGRCTCSDPNCTSPGKHAPNDWQSTATTDQKKIRSWGSGGSPINIGIPLGESTNLVVIDIPLRIFVDNKDPRDSDPATPINLMTILDPESYPHSDRPQPEFPKHWDKETIKAFRETYHVATPNGFHFYFRIDQTEDGRKIADKSIFVTTVDFEENINFLSTGSYVVAPGSLTKTGRIYEVLYRPEPGTSEDPASPEKSKKPLSKDAFKAIPKFIEKIFIDRKIDRTKIPDENKWLGDDRHDNLFRAGVLQQRTFKQTYAELFKTIRKLNDTQCSPEIGELELKRLVEAVLQHVKKKPQAFDSASKYSDRNGVTGALNESMLFQLLMGDPYLSGMVYEDEQTGAIEFDERWVSKNQTEYGQSISHFFIKPSQLYFERDLLPGEYSPIRWTDVNTTQLLSHVQSVFRMNANRRSVQDALQMVAAERRRNRYVEWLVDNAKNWDGIKRITPDIDPNTGEPVHPEYGISMMHMLYGIPDTYDEEIGLTKSQRREYGRFLSKNLIMGAIQRSLQPGCPNDLMIILVGKQGIGKSKGLRKLFGQTRVTDADHDIGTAKFYQSTDGKSIIEFAELDKIRKEDLTVIKSYGSKQVVNYMKAYARTPTENPIRSIPVGTTNDNDILRDPTGERRSLPIVVYQFNEDYVAAHRTQLFAEGAHRVLAGEKFHRLPNFMDKIHLSHKETEIWSDSILDYINPKGGLRKDEIRMIDLVTGPLSMIKPIPTKQRIGAALRLLGLEPRQVRIGEERTIRWYWKETEKRKPGRPGEDDPDYIEFENE